jgi:hypothetical protein
LQYGVAKILNITRRSLSREQFLMLIISNWAKKDLDRSPERSNFVNHKNKENKK